MLSITGDEEAPSDEGLAKAAISCASPMPFQSKWAKLGDADAADGEEKVGLLSPIGGHRSATCCGAPHQALL